MKKGDLLMFCPNCGTQVDNHLNFCPKCGKPLHPSSSHQIPPNAYQHYSSQSVPPTAGPAGHFNYQRIRMDMLILSIASILVILGSFLPWATESTLGISYNGITGGKSAGSGLFILFSAVLDLVFALVSFSKPSRKLGFKITILVLSIIMFIMSCSGIAAINSVNNFYGEDVHMGAGLILMLPGSLISIVMGVISIIHSVKK
jgi:hypothetical protein